MARRRGRHNSGMWSIALLLLGYQQTKSPALIPFSQLETQHTLTVRVGRDVWRCRSCRGRGKFMEKHPEFEDGIGVAVFEKNGTPVLKVMPGAGPFIESCRVAIRPGYPVIAVRGAYGLGVHWDTLFFAIRHGRLIRMGGPPAMNSRGPVLWHGRKDVWAFDDFDRYEFMAAHRRLPRIVLMKVGRDLRLRRWRTLRPQRKRLPTTVHTPGVE